MASSIMICIMYVCDYKNIFRTRIHLQYKCVSCVYSVVSFVIGPQSIWIEIEHNVTNITSEFVCRKRFDYSDNLTGFFSLPKNQVNGDLLRSTFPAFFFLRLPSVIIRNSFKIRNTS